MSDQTLASSSESVLLAAQVPPTSPIDVVSSAPVVPAPTASQFSRELEDIRLTEALVSMREEPNTTHTSHTLDTSIHITSIEGMLMTRDNRKSRQMALDSLSVLTHEFKVPIVNL